MHQARFYFCTKHNQQAAQHNTARWKILQRTEIYCLCAQHQPQLIPMFTCKYQNVFYFEEHSSLEAYLLGRLGLPCYVQAFLRGINGDDGKTRPTPAIGPRRTSLKHNCETKSPQKISHIIISHAITVRGLTMRCIVKSEAEWNEKCKYRWTCVTNKMCLDSNKRLFTSHFRHAFTRSRAPR